jgi:exopolysaccharide biosynthesis polyprenyl glycosylphosphotransferase
LTDLELVDDLQVATPRVRERADPRSARTFPREPLLRRMLAVADGLAALAGSAVLALSEETFGATVWAAFFVPVWVFLAKLFGLYDRDHRALRHVTADEVQSIFLWALTGTAALTLFLHATPTGSAPPASALLTLVVVFAAALVLRGATRMLWRAATPPERTLILGEGPLADATRRKLELFPDIHIEILDERDWFSLNELGSLNGQLNGIDRVILASQTLDEAVLGRLIVACRRHRTRLSVVPPARGMFGTAVHLTHVAELPVVEYNTWDVGRSTLLLKRVLDILVASIALVLLAPLLLAIALAIRLTSRGPAIFAQLRAGRHGRSFRMLKFRTMVIDAEARLCEVVSVDELTEPMFKLRRDPRVTPLGRLLRRTSLDELPQLLNVLRGEMSLVGPRPEQLDLVARYTPEQRLRLEAKPGITGPMQVYGRGELSFEERLAVEREYIENLSLTRDLRILALTIGTVLSGRGAF